MWFRFLKMIFLVQNRFDLLLVILIIFIYYKKRNRFIINIEILNTIDVLRVGSISIARR